MSDKELDNGRIKLLLGDCIERMKDITDNSIDAIVTDPPYFLTGGTGASGFMGKNWDGESGMKDSLSEEHEELSGPMVFQKFSEAWAKEAFRILKPGGHLLSFAGSRTYHRMTCGIEDAGFEIRDQIDWVYGCLDEDTMAVTKKGVLSFKEVKVGDEALCYDLKTGAYSYQKIQKVLVYDHEDTAYRIVGNFGEQVVTGCHRLIVECNGRETFVTAKACEQEIRVPILENLRELQDALSDGDKRSGSQKQILLSDVCADRSVAPPEENTTARERKNDAVCSVRCRNVEAEFVVKKVARPNQSDVQSPLCRCITCERISETFTQGEGSVDTREQPQVCGTDERANQPIVERWCDIQEAEGELRVSDDKKCEVPDRVTANGKKRWIHNGTSHDCCTGCWKATEESRNSTSYKPRRNGQQGGESDDIQHECRPQEIRKWRGHKTVMVRVERYEYAGKVWCLQVPTGAFVAVRNGVAFPTGNSGMPKSMNVSKAIDKAAGAEREVVGSKVGMPGYSLKPNDSDDHGRVCYGKYTNAEKECAITAPATDDAKTWDGWGTQLKPAHEPICMARKPLIGTVVQNVLTHGTGAINIDACRVPTSDSLSGGDVNATTKEKTEGWDRPWMHDEESKKAHAERVKENVARAESLGRFPSNFVHDGSDEVLALFPDSNGAGKSLPRVKITGYGDGIGTGKSEYLGGDRIPFECGTGSAARFFYCAKSSTSERHYGMDDAPVEPQFAHGDTLRKIENKLSGKGNAHPTVKPLALMKHLIKMVTPRGGVVLDPFMGSGSTGIAAAQEGFRFIGIEREEEYFEICAKRIGFAVSETAKIKTDNNEFGSLFDDE